MRKNTYASRTLAIATMAMILLPAPVGAEEGGGERQPLPRAHYLTIATKSCAEAVKKDPLPSTTEKILRPLVVYLVADELTAPRYAFICLQSNQISRSKVSVAYTAFNRNGVMPAFYGDNSERCRPEQNEQTMPICAASSFVTDGTSVMPAVTPVSVGTSREYGAIASVRTSFGLTAEGTATAYRAYHHVRIETIDF